MNGVDAMNGIKSIGALVILSAIAFAGVPGVMADAAPGSCCGPALLLGFAGIMYAIGRR